MTSQPRSRRAFTAVSMASSVSEPLSMSSCSVSRYLPGASSMLPTVVSEPARPAPAPLPMPMMPTFATSPSRRALVACVVPWAMKTTSSGEIPLLVRTLSIAWTMPAATPCAAWWVVGTFSLAMTS